MDVEDILNAFKHLPLCCGMNKNMYSYKSLQNVEGEEHSPGGRLEFVLTNKKPGNTSLRMSMLRLLRIIATLLKSIVNFCAFYHLDTQKINCQLIM